jgi:Mor family transcriptional regulator
MKLAMVRVQSKKNNSGDEFLDHLYAFLVQRLTGDGLYDEHDASDLASRFVSEARSCFGGLQFYVSKKDIIGERDENMFAEFNGNNHAKLAIRYGLSMQQVYKRLAMIRQRKRTGGGQ